ncbi:MAG: hypothetical protein DMG98_10785 [Acidobacteria bacterium]|nr:MAG: hypothetical protein DMG98_10785 [Acidobacteriota bacterium]
MFLILSVIPSEHPIRSESPCGVEEPAVSLPAYQIAPIAILPASFAEKQVPRLQRSFAKTNDLFRSG